MTTRKRRKPIHKSAAEIENAIRMRGTKSSTVVHKQAFSKNLSSAAIEKRDACNQYYDRAYGECKRRGLAFYNQLLADGFSTLKAGDICRKELLMLSTRSLREILPDEAKHESMRRLPQSQSTSSSSSPKEEIAADLPQITKAANEELPQELKDYAGVKTSQIVSKYQQLTGQKPESESKPELEPGQVSIPHAEWDPRKSSMWGECPKSKKTGHQRKEELDKHGSYEVYWMHSDIKNYVWKVCKIDKINTEVKRSQVEEETQETYQIEPKDYDLNDLEKYDRAMLIRIVQFLHEKLTKLKTKSRPANQSSSKQQQQKQLQQVESTLPEAIRGGKFMNYNQASYIARLQKITTRAQWREYTKSDNFPADIPKRPDFQYESEWEGWPAFFGKNRAE